VQNHLGPEQARRLVAALRRGSGGGFVLVGHGEFAGHARADEVARALDVEVFALGAPARRGYFSLVEPYFAAVDWLGERGIDYDWLVYLSGQDYPTRPLAAFEERLAAAGCDGFLRFWDAAAPLGPGRRRRQGIVRYFYQYRDAPAWSRPLLPLLRFACRALPPVEVHLTYGPRIGVRDRRLPFRGGVRCWAGTQWTALRRACAEEVTRRVRAGDAVADWFRRTVCPDEAVVQTLLVNGGRFRLVNDDLRYVDLAGSRDGRPRTLGAADLPALAGGTHCFARKVDALADPGLLDRLDERIAGPHG
jgi:hypothetical protein